MSKSRYSSNNVRVLPAGAKGRGVFAKGALVAGEVIEFAPVLVLKPGDRETLLKTEIKHHAFDLGRGRVGLGLGYTSLYNHSRSPNAEFESSPDGIRIVARRGIRPDEEILINYRWTDRELDESGIARHS
jgi:SET domain-containing protein